MKHLNGEVNSCKQTMQRHLLLFSGGQLVISVGATPPAMSSKDILRKDKLSPEMKSSRNLLQGSPLSDTDAKVNDELHAGVYPLLDMQQLSTNTSTQLRSPKDDVAVSVLAEVCSIYSDGERSSPEALLAAGTLAPGNAQVILAGQQYLRCDYSLRTCLRILLCIVSAKRAPLSHGSPKWAISLAFHFLLGRWLSSSRITLVLPSHSTISTLW